MMSEAGFVAELLDWELQGQSRALNSHELGCMSECFIKWEFSESSVSAFYRFYTCFVVFYSLNLFVWSHLK